MSLTIPTLPAEFDAIAPNHELAISLFANGTETYQCNGTAWNFADAHADLFDNLSDKQTRFGVHDIFMEAPDEKGGYANWVSDKDGSSVNGAVASLVPVEGALPTIDIGVTIHGGKGEFSDVVRILRFNAQGIQPSRACEEGETEIINYTCDYLFLKEKEGYDGISSGSKMAAWSAVGVVFAAFFL